MSRSGYFSGVFGKSPITPLQQHMEKVCTCTEVLLPYFQAVLAEDWDRARKLHGQLVEIENQADDIKNKLRRQMPASLFMAMDRRDVLEVLDLQDAVANKAKDISGLVIGRRMSMPKVLHEPYSALLARCIDACRQARTTINELDELLETGFRGKEKTRVQGLIEVLQDIEHETDQMQVSLRGVLFEFEHDLNPVNVMFLYDIIKWTGDLADLAQSTGNRVQLMIAK